MSTKPNAAPAGNAKPGNQQQQQQGSNNKNATNQQASRPSLAPAGNENRKVTNVPGRAGPRQASQKNLKEPTVIEIKLEEHTQDCPPGLFRLFLTNNTQQAFNVRSEEDVTQEDNIRTIKKEQVLEDISRRQVGSDFFPLKKQIEEFEDEEILIIYDYDFQYDKNYYVCLNQELKSFILNPPLIQPPEVQKELPRYIPPVSKPWVSLGSEHEINEEIFSDRRPLLKYQIKISRPSFNRQPKFKDVDAETKKDLSINIQSSEETPVKLKMMELERAVQAAPSLTDAVAQTVWRYPKNVAIQYEPRTLNEKEIEVHLKSENLAKFIKESYPMFEAALQQNDIFNPFDNDWISLGSEMSAIGGPGEIHLKEYQSFSDIHNSKNKVVTCVQWHPTLKGIVAMSLAENYSFYDRMDNLAKSVISPSLILIWSFVDPIQPKLMLESPGDIFMFSFSPTEPNVIAGGCINGQLVLWDIAPWQERIINPRADHRDKNLFIPGFEDESYFQTPRIRYCALSSLEHGHTSPVTDLIWVPDHFEIDRMGLPIESKNTTNYQLITAATDNQILFWDTRSKSTNPKKKELDLPMHVPTTFKHLAMWRPILKVALPCADPGGDFAPTKFSIEERQGDKSIIQLEDKLEIEKRGGDDPSTRGNFVAQTSTGNSSKQNRLLQHLNTRISIGTEDGQLVYVDWLPQKEADSSKLTSTKAEWYGSVSDGPIVALKRSPFFKDIMLIAGGTGFSIWREKVFSGALLQTKAFPKRICDAEWSPTRPGVFFIAKSDGTIDIWDLLDRTHAPMLTQSISIHRLAFICCRVVSPKQQLIGIGDNVGTLHIMEVPWALRRNISGEYQAVKAYFQRETERRDFVKKRWDFREEEKRELERQAALKAGLGPPHIPTEDEITYRLRNDYNDYLQFEAAILRELGLKDEDDQPPMVAAN